MTKIGLVQATACEAVSENFQTLANFVREAAEAGCEALCFPECFLTGYVPKKAEELAIPPDSPVLQQVSDLAVSSGVDILAGFMEKGEAGCFITHGIFRKDGTRDRYRKSHLGSRERLYFLPGDVLDVFTITGGLRIGIQLCVETHYPEITQTYALRGAEVVFAPHAVPRVSGDRKKIWGKYIFARSYDNRVYMACCNLWDPDRFGGGCLVTDPRGEETAAWYGEESHLLVCEIDREALAQYRTPGHKRAVHYYPEKRRPELYD